DGTAKSLLMVVQTSCLRKIGRQAGCLHHKYRTYPLHFHFLPERHRLTGIGIEHSYVKTCDGKGYMHISFV
ncbi:MAG: hypothetical protein ACE15F_19570, partial [bacterium]